MDREYLEDYEEREKAEYEELVTRKIEDGRFNFGEDRYPPDRRFVKLQKPVAKASARSKHITNVWAQIPFCGSLIINIPAYSQSDFERVFFKVTEIPNILDFIKETGKLQIMFNEPPITYAGLDFLDPFFKELNPPIYSTAPITVFGTDKDRKEADETFHAIGSLKYFAFVKERSYQVDSRLFWSVLLKSKKTYVNLKLGRYGIAEDIDNLMVDNPQAAYALLAICQALIVDPLIGLRSDLSNFTLREMRRFQELPLVYQPEELRFPCEIGKFLLRNSTYAAKDMRACCELMDNYDAYDLRKVQESLNDAIVTNHPDIVNKSAEEFSEILDNVWNDPAVPRRIKNLRRGIPMSIAAIGTAVSTFTGGIGGFLAGLGFSVGAAFLKAEIEEISEKVGTFFAKRSYQANVYDFKKKYKDKIVK